MTMGPRNKWNEPMSRLALCVMGLVILPNLDNHSHALCMSACGYGQKSWDRS